MAKSPFAMVRNVLLLTIMKKMSAVILGLSLIGTMAEAAAPITGGQPPRMTPDQALKLLMGNGFMARTYYNGVPDPAVVRQVDNRARMRAMINAKLSSMVIPKIDQLWDFTMEEAIESLEATFKRHDPEGLGFQLHINQFVDPGGVPIQGDGNGGGEDFGGEDDGGMAIDPATGLPIGGGAIGGVGGAPQIDPTTGLPIGAGVGGVPPGMGGGLTNLPGMGGVLPGMPGMGGGGRASGGAFDPTVVKVRGLKKELVNLTAKQILDIFVMSLDSPIQYIVTDQGIMFLQQKAELVGTKTRMFQLNLNQRSLQMMGVATPELQAPTNGNGGGQNGNGGGQNGGGFGQNGGGFGQNGGGQFGGGQFGGGQFGGGQPGGGQQPGVAYKTTGGGFGSSYRPFSNLNRFAPATGGN